MTYNQNLRQHDYYHQPLDSGCCPPQPPMPCPPHHNHDGLQACAAPPWIADLAAHNLDKNAHPYLLKLFKSSSLYYCKDTLAARDAIEEGIRKEGLMVYVLETDMLYRLERGISNNDWRELNVNSQQYIKLGRLNPPLKPTDGTVYFNLIKERLYVYLLGSWVALPNHKDLQKAILEHNVDPEAHADRFAEVENIWFTI